MISDKLKDVMLDFETLGNGKNACVVQIGAAYFCRKTGEVGATLKLNVDAESAIKSGAEMDASTVYWWLSQDKPAIDSIIAQPRTDIGMAFAELNGFLKDAENIWSHATFDFVILSETMKRIDLKPTFKYKVARDIRTLVDLAQVKYNHKTRDDVHHDALADCKYQIAYCVEAFNKLKVSYDKG